MFGRRTTFALAPWLLAVVLLAVQTFAYAHELQHDLKQHDDTSCVLHLHAKQAGQPTADAALVVVAPIRTERLPTAGAVPYPARVLGYRTRAPPHSSVRSN